MSLLSNIFSSKKRDITASTNTSANRLVKFRTYQEFQEERVFYAYRPLMYIGVFLDIIYIYGDYVNHGVSQAFIWISLGRMGAASFTAFIVYVTYREFFREYRGLWILLFGNSSLLCLLVPYMFFDPHFYYVTYTWVFYMISTILLSPILSNKTFLSVHFGAVVIVTILLGFAHKTEEQIGEFVTFMVPVSLYLWAAIVAYRKEAELSYKNAYQNHIYMTLDTLSQLLNRREFYLQSINEWNNSQRDSTPLSFIMLDIDHFKKVNDTYGHECGDIVIKTVSDKLLAGTRDSDIVGRLGGEEFGIVLPNTNIHDAVDIAERIRQDVESTRIEYEGHMLHVTISIGVTAQNISTNDFSSLVSIGDKNLYTAKNGGRNRVVAE